MSSLNEAPNRNEWHADIPLDRFKILAQGLWYPQDIGALVTDDNALKKAGEIVGKYIREARPANATSTT